MAYKPYRSNNRDIYIKYDDKRNISYSSGSVKVFGFRSGSALKMITAILYYAFMIFYLVTAIYGEVTNLKYSSMDVVLTILKYIFVSVMIFSPFIFLSDFKYRDNIPFFKKHQAGASAIGMIIVFMFCSFMIEVNLMCMSNVYEKSYQDMAKKQEKLRQERLKEIESNTTIEITSKSSYNFNENRYYI